MQTLPDIVSPAPWQGALTRFSAPLLPKPPVRERDVAFEVAVLQPYQGGGSLRRAVGDNNPGVIVHGGGLRHLAFFADFF